jgi:transposase
MSGKKTWGRKRHVLVDTQGNLLAVKVTGAHRSDQQGAKVMLKPLREIFPRMKLRMAAIPTTAARSSAGCAGTWAGPYRRYAPSGCPNADYWFPRGPRSIGMPSFRQAFVRCPRDGWSSEPSPGLRGFRRLARDHEGLPQSSEAFIKLSASRRFLSLLAPPFP